MPLPGSGCKKSRPIKVKVNFGAIKVVFIQPVKMAKTEQPKNNTENY